MKIKIDFRLEDDLVIPVNYNHIVQAFILNSMKDENLQRFIHDKGYECNGRKFKNYCFSKLYGKFSLDRERKKIRFYDRVSLYISSMEEKILKSIGDSLMFSSENFIGKTRVEAEKIEFIRETPLEAMRVYALSPITIYSTLSGENFRKTYYYSPYEKEFSDLIRENLIKKYESYYKKLPENTEFHIEPAGRNREAVVVYKGFIVKGWNGEFDIAGSKELIDTALSAGAGGKNSQGFGCIMEKK